LDGTVATRPETTVAGAANAYEERLRAPMEMVVNFMIAVREGG